MPNIAEDVFIAPGAMVIGDVILLRLISPTLIGFSPGFTCLRTLRDPDLTAILTAKQVLRQWRTLY
jgi:hypothetical protein